MQDFSEELFPLDISYGAQGGPEFSTNVITTQSGHEQRNINWSEARVSYKVAHGVKTQLQLNKLIEFFRLHRGRAIGFRFRDPIDHYAHKQLIGTGNNIKTQFQLVKYYGDICRVIRKPIEDSIKIYTEDYDLIDYEVDYTTGLVTFSVPPSKDLFIYADFGFDIAARFDSDKLSASLDQFGSYSWYNIGIIEIK